MQKIVYFILLALAFLPVVVVAQNRVITGHVSDGSSPLIGASVQEKGLPNNGVVTSGDGRFSITLRGTSEVLEVGHIGFVRQSFNVKGKNSLTVTLKRDDKGLDEVVIVGYGKKKRLTNTGAVSSVSGSTVQAVPTTNIQNALVGKLPGYFSQQRGGQPGADAADFFIRGQSSLNTTNGNQPLIIVDDIEYTYAQVSQLDANEIESVSILKDASTTAVYGIRGANGVMVITTKRGYSGKPRITLTAETGVQHIITMPEYLNAYQTALLRNEAVQNDNYGLPQSSWKAPDFTDRDLQLFKDHSDPYGHPDVNWVKALINRDAPQSRYNVDIQGGNNIIKYFLSLGYLTQNGAVKNFAPANPGQESYNNNYYYRRTDFRSNLDINPNRRLKIRLDFSGRLGEQNGPAGVWDNTQTSSANTGIFYRLSNYNWTAPYIYPLRNPNGSYPYSNYPWTKTSGLMTNESIIALLSEGGYNRNYTNDLNIVLQSSYQLDFITRGLSASGTLSYASSLAYYRNLRSSYINSGNGITNPYPSYFYNPTADTTGGKAYTINGSNYALPTYSRSGGVNSGAVMRTTNVQANLNYDRVFVGGHHVYGLALFNQRSASINNTDITLNDIPANYRGFTGRAGYDYRSKYLIEFDIARNGSDKFNANHRYGTFPAASAGWNVAEEKFFKKLFPSIDLFKVRGSYGLVGSDVTSTGQYLYTQTYAVNTSYNFGLAPNTNITGLNGGIREGTLPNQNVTWEKERKTDVGLDVNMFNGKLSLTADYFYDYRYDQLITLGDVPALIGQSLPPLNLGKTQNRGYDGQVSYHSSVGKVGFTIGLTASYAKNKVLYISEAPLYPYLAQTGQPIGAQTGYITHGFYKSATDIANSPKSTLAPIIEPGDFKFEDLNHDGIIDARDRTFIGKPNLPTTTGGLSLGVNYKGLSVDVMFQGATGYDIRPSAEGNDPFHGNLRPMHLRRWTPATASTALVPRLTTNSSSFNSGWLTNNSIWMTDASYVRLKTVSISYMLNARWMRNAKIQTCRIYAIGYDLVTWRSYNRFEQDPEVAFGNGGNATGYPTTANINVGVQLGF